MEIGEKERSAIDRRLAALEADRQIYEPDYKELEENFAPRRARWQVNGQRRRQSRNTDIINGTPIYAVTVLKSGMMSGHTSPSRPWFKLVSPDPDLMENDGVRHWLYLVELRMREVFARSNIYNALPACYGDLGVFGASALGIYKDDKDTIRCFPYTMGSYGIGNSSRLSVDSFSRKWETTVGRLVEQFGLENCSKSVREAWENKNFDVKVNVCHLLEPNRNADPRYLDASAMAYRSIYWEAGWPDGKALLSEGFMEMPILVPRWETLGEESWGDSPALNCLGDAKQLQFEERRKAQILDKLANPAYKIDPSLKNKANLGPNGKNYISMTAGNPGIEAVYVPHPQAYEYVRQGVVELENRVRQHMFVDIFLMLAESDRRQITAREVEEKHAEKLMMLGPVLERLSDELLDPAIQRTFRIMLQQGLIPEWPPELDGQALKIEYISILAQAQKAVSTAAIEAVGGYVLNFAQVAPEAMDKFDIDQAVDEYSQMKGAPPTIIRSDEAVAAIRRRRQEALQAQQTAELAAQAAAATKDLANAPMGEGSALDALVG